MFFTRVSDFKSYIAKLNKIGATYDSKENSRESSYFLTVPLAFMGNPETLVKGLPRGKTAPKKLTSAG